jgi:multiple sugar transport system substrate-binding protein
MRGKYDSWVRGVYLFVNWFKRKNLRRYEMSKKSIRSMLVLCLVIFFIPVGMLFATGAQAIEGFSWKKYDGKKIRMMFAQKQWAEIIMDKIGEFEEMTGIEVIAESFPENQYRQKLAIELASGTGSVDVFMTDPVVDGTLFYKSGWIQTLNSFLENNNITNPDFDYDDFLGATRDATTKEGGDIIGVCSEADGQIFYYNTKIFAEYGVDVPEKLSDIETVAKTIHEKSGGDTYGIVMRGMGPKAVSQWSTFMVNLGGWWVDDNGNANLTSPENIEAFTLYGRLLREYGPPGAANLDWPDALALFAQGNVGMFCDAASFRKTVVDESSSTIVDSWSAAPMPAGPNGTHPMTNFWMLAISKASKAKEPAWLFAQWALSKEMVLESLLNGIPSPRSSAWENPKFKNQDPYPEWTNAFMQNLKTGNPQFQAPVINVPKAKDIIGPVIDASISGEDVTAAAKKANKELQELIEEEREKYGN